MTRLETEVLAATMNLSVIEVSLAVALVNCDETLTDADRLAALRVLRQAAPLVDPGEIGAVLALIAAAQRGTYQPPNALKRLWASIDAAGLRDECERAMHWYAMLMRTAHALREIKGMDAGAPPSKTTLH